MIKELETTITNLKQTNFVLEERIKLFEESKRKDIADQYFPLPGHSKSASPTTAIPKSSVSTSCSSQPGQQACTCCTRFCLQKVPESPPLDNTKIDTLAEVISALNAQVGALQGKLNQCSKSASQNSTKSNLNGQYTSPSSSSPANNHDKDVNQEIPPDIATSTRANPNLSNCSVNTIDEDVPESPIMEHLNSNLLTTQLHQLGQSLKHTQQ